MDPSLALRVTRGPQGDMKSNECHCEELSKESDVAIHGPFAALRGTSLDFIHNSLSNPQPDYRI